MPCKPVRRLFAALLTGLIGAHPVIASPFDGTWTASDPVNAPEHDEFILNIWTTGRNLCATVEATGHLGMKVDEDEDNIPSVKGTFQDNTANVDFVSSWGGKGKAVMSLKDGKLIWSIVRVTGDSWIWQDATMARPNPLPLGSRASCDRQPIKKRAK